MRGFGLFVMLAVLACPAFAEDRLSVAELEKAIAANHGKSDKDMAQRLGNLELTERLSTVRLQRLEAELPGEKARLALLALGDASAFLDLPPYDVPALAPPDPATQGKIMSRAADFVMSTISKMPDFFAMRTITRFQDLKVSSVYRYTVVVPNHSFLFLDRSNATVLFRNGREVVEAAEKNKKGTALTASTGLTNWGVFGPLLGLVMADILKGKMGWGHWEQGATGQVAVFRYQVPEDRSNYTVRYCCFFGNQGAMREYEGIPEYHGEIAIDPASGAVLRLVVKTDLKPGPPISRSDVAVEYSSVEIGGKSYICPVKSISITTAAAMVFHGVMLYDGRRVEKPVEEPNVTAINDVAFEKYHQFRTEMRILPADGADPNADPNAVPNATPPAPPPTPQARKP